MKTVRSFANESDECGRYDVKLIDVYKVQLKQAVAYAGFMWSNEVSSTFDCTGSTLYNKYLLLIVPL